MRTAAHNYLTLALAAVRSAGIVRVAEIGRGSLDRGKALVYLDEIERAGMTPVQQVTAQITVEWLMMPWNEIAFHEQTFTLDQAMRKELPDALPMGANVALIDGGGLVTARYLVRYPLQLAVADGSAETLRMQ
jgi:hypothetical protein